MKFLINLLITTVLGSSLSYGSGRRCKDAIDEKTNNPPSSDDLKHAKGFSQTSRVSEWVQLAMALPNRNPEILERITRFDQLTDYYLDHYTIKNFKSKPVSLMFFDGSSLLTNQIKTLEPWLTYLTSTETDQFPLWLRVWAFYGVLRVGSWDEVQGRFGHRSQGQRAPFVELNREVLAATLSQIRNVFETRNDNLSGKNPASPAKLFHLVSLDQFAAVYGAKLFDFKKTELKRNLETSGGVWRSFLRNSDPGILVDSLGGKCTGWCIASPETAKERLQKNDFHIYFTPGSQGLQPRLAIQVHELSGITEIRGIEDGQNIDDAIAQSPILETKLIELGLNDYGVALKLEQQKNINKIILKERSGQSLTAKELRQIYAIDVAHLSFGYSKDPRIEKFLSKRDIRSDLAKAFGGRYSKDDFSLTEEEALMGGKRVHFGNLDLSKFSSLEGKDLSTLEIVLGHLDLSGLNTDRGLDLSNLREVHGNFKLWNLEEARFLAMPRLTKIWGVFDLQNLQKGERLNLVSLVSVGNHLNLDSLISSKGLNLDRLEYVGGSLDLWSLLNAKDLGLKSLKLVGLHINIENLIELENLSFDSRINVGAGIILNRMIRPEQINYKGPFNYR